MALDLEPQIRIVAAMLTNAANKAAVFDPELDDDAAGAIYKAAIRARIKLLLQAADTALTAIIGQL